LLSIQKTHTTVVRAEPSVPVPLSTTRPVNLAYHSSNSSVQHKAAVSQQQQDQMLVNMIKPPSSFLSDKSRKALTLLSAAHRPPPLRVSSREVSYEDTDIRSTNNGVILKHRMMPSAPHVREVSYKDSEIHNITSTTDNKLRMVPVRGFVNSNVFAYGNYGSQSRGLMASESSITQNLPSDLSQSHQFGRKRSYTNEIHDISRQDGGFVKKKSADVKNLSDCHKVHVDIAPKVKIEEISEDNCIYDIPNKKLKVMNKVNTAREPTVALFSAAMKILGDSASLQSTPTQSLLKIKSAVGKDNKKEELITSEKSQKEEKKYPPKYPAMRLITYPPSFVPVIRLLKSLDWSRANKNRVEQFTQILIGMREAAAKEMKEHPNEHKVQEMDKIVVHPHCDILLGRGGGVNFHPANVRLRHIVHLFRRIYVDASRKDKPIIAKMTYEYIKDSWVPTCRFIQKDGTMNYKAHSSSGTKAIEKISQLFREKPKDGDIQVTDDVNGDLKILATVKVMNIISNLKSEGHFP